ncbi:sensor histidine kinase [Blastochloris viridis]|nr:HAMP domain-containing sensor histidine kinase [Blastochloris viridis]ALK08644.1 Non-motile and phage-resistance protein [Blastochloris viridis]CUU41307.1 Non-motile and phage-resistance protein [Blastochloris viridis]
MEDAARAASERRRATARRVREARDRLTSTTGTRPAFDLELTRLFATSRQSAALPMAAVIVVIGLSSVLWTGMFQAGLWTLMVLFIHGLTLLACRSFLRSEADPARVRRVRVVLTAFDFLFGLSWVLHVTQLHASGAPGAGEFSLFALLLITTVLIMLSAGLPSAAIAGTLPITVALVAIYLASGRTQDYVLAGIAAAGQFYYYILARHIHANALAMLEARTEKEALIGELEQAMARSDEAARRAEAASLSKSRFLAQMSHELRTPLNAILGFSEVMKSEVLGPHQVPTYKEYSSDIHNSGQHLLNLINEILDLSRIEAGRYQLNEESVPLVGVAEDCVHLMAMRAKTRGITLIELYETNLPPLWADERALRQIVLNLLSNAIKFTPQGGEIVIKIGWTASGGQYLAVKDNGPGIPENELSVVLSSFGQGSNAIKSAEQGAGLGLPIVQNLVDLHGGTFNLASEVREGTEVLVTFPASRVMAALPPVAETVPLVPSSEPRPAAEDPANADKMFGLF